MPSDVVIVTVLLFSLFLFLSLFVVMVVVITMIIKFRTVLCREILTGLTTQTVLSRYLSFSAGKCARMKFCGNFFDAPVLLPYFSDNQAIQDMNSNNRDLRVRVHVRKAAGRGGGIAYGILKGRTN